MVQKTIYILGHQGYVMMRHFWLLQEKALSDIGVCVLEYRLSWAYILPISLPLIFTFVVLLHLSPGYIYSPNISSPQFFTFSALLHFSWVYFHPISFPQMAYCCKYCLSTQDIPLQSLFQTYFCVHTMDSIVLPVIIGAG